jgi:site-specific recombinase XerD
MRDRTLIGPWIRRFLLEHLVSDRNLTRNTQASYRDTLLLLLPFVSQAQKRPTDRLMIDDLSPSRLRSFLEYLEKERGCSGATPVRLVGKANKTRSCPIWKRTVDVLKPLVAGRNTQEFVFLNRRDEPLTRFGIYSLVRRAVDQASRTLPSIAAKRISPHCLRHSCAVHLLRSGVDINTIRAWLGHVSLDTTHIYAEVDLEMKAKALALCDLPNDVATKPWHSDPGLIGFLRAL